MNMPVAVLAASVRSRQVVDLVGQAKLAEISKELATVPIASLLPGESPRLQGHDADHVARLVEFDAPLPPILVDRRTKRVIDGMHRLLAASLQGHETITVEFFDGTTEEAFLRAVEANVTHGLPLSGEERRAAAARIIESHPQMSDRAIARASGLGTKAIATIRRRSAEVTPQLTARVGRDGKVRPLSSLEGRKKAGELMAANPQASLREIARLAGISPATVSDVRKRMQLGETTTVKRPPMTEADCGHDDYVMAGQVVTGVASRKVRPAQPDPVPALERLSRDPSLRHKEDGRHLLRVLQQNAIGVQELAKLAAAVPSHCESMIINLARQFAESWGEFAKELDERVRDADLEATVDA